GSRTSADAQADSDFVCEVIQPAGVFVLMRQNSGPVAIDGVVTRPTAASKGPTEEKVPGVKSLSNRLVSSHCSSIAIDAGDQRKSTELVFAMHRLTVAWSPFAAQGVI